MMIVATITKRLFADPRHYQIAALSGLLAIGLAMRAFDISLTQIIAIFAVALSAQYLGSLLNAVRFDPRSALITSLSLSLLLRSDTMAPLMIAAAIAVGSKFTLRLYGKHIFNPANVGIVALLLLSGDVFPGAAWSTPGQWGTAIWFAALIAGAGLLVTYRAARMDVPLIFLGAFAALIFMRAIWLGDPLSIPLLRLQNGALLLYAFFMISDPKTTPDGTFSRAAFAIGAAILTYVLSYHFYITDGLFYALAIMCIARPALEWLDPAPHYRWGDRPALVTPKFLPRSLRQRRSPQHTHHPLPAE